VTYVCNTALVFVTENCPVFSTVFDIPMPPIVFNIMNGFLFLYLVYFLFFVRPPRVESKSKKGLF